MRIDIVALCEYASENEGKLTIVDTFDTIRAEKLPWREYFYVVAKIVLNKQDLWPSEIWLVIEKDNHSEEPVFKTCFPQNKADALSSGSNKLNIVAGFKGLIFDAEGDYNFRVKFDNQVILSHPFKVVLEK